MAREMIRFQFGKYNGDEHWGYDLEMLGADEHGEWFGGRRGIPMTKPGTSVKAQNDFLVLVPGNDAWWVATFNKTPGGESRTAEVYVDIATPATVNQGEAFSLDLDLDVVRRVGGGVEIDDEDEFAAHTTEWAYPQRLVSSAREAADTVKALMENGDAPFDGAHEKWFAKL